jgi:sugar phosphate isomerase/epimerase
MIFVSTSSLNDHKSVIHVLKEYKKGGIQNIELGSSHKYEEGIKEFVKKFQKENDVNYTVHAYFPPAKESFFVNLASQDEQILSRSKNFVRDMIELSSEVNAVLCGFHAGFRFDPIHGVKYGDTPILDYHVAYDIFLQSLISICKFADEKKVKICFEPNVVSKNNLINNQNKLLLMAEIGEINNLFHDLETRGVTNLFLLLDLGHLKVTANNLNFDFTTFIDTFKERVLEIHIHDNQGVFDQHFKLEENSEVLEVLKNYKFKSLEALTLESHKLTIEQINEQCDLLQLYT